jgi:hypothetical protein
LTLSSQLLTGIEPEAQAFSSAIPNILDGRDAAFATVTLMSQVGTIISPNALCDEYLRLGGGASAPVVDGLWSAFGKETAMVMGAGARYLAAIWDAAFAVAERPSLADAGVVSQEDLAAIYQDKAFVPSLTLDKIGTVLRE